jgi:hypothetical protein
MDGFKEIDVQYITAWMDLRKLMYNTLLHDWM